MFYCPATISCHDSPSGNAYNNPMTRVVLMEDYLDETKDVECVKRLAKRVDLRIYTTKASSEDELAERLRDADMLITIRDRVRYPESLLARMGHLKLLSVAGARI